MTPQERQMVDDLFDRLAHLETAPRDAAAERAIADGLARSPNAIYPLVQTVLVQDEALKRADARIRELTGEDAGEPASGGFLDSMRDALTGRATATSVPRVRPNASTEPDPRWNSGGALATTAAAPLAGRARRLVPRHRCSIGRRRDRRRAASQFDKFDVRSSRRRQRVRGGTPDGFTVEQQCLRQRSRT